MAQPPGKFRESSFPPFPFNLINSLRFMWLSIALAFLLLLTGCHKDTQVGEITKVRVGYIGLTCEAPIFTAVEKGFFKEEGLDVSLVKCEWANYKDVLALG